MGSDVTFLDISAGFPRMPTHNTSRRNPYWSYALTFECKLLAKFSSSILSIVFVISNTMEVKLRIDTQTRRYLLPLKITSKDIEGPKTSRFR
jgi:hypothetical protein